MNSKPNENTLLRKVAGIIESNLHFSPYLYLYNVKCN